MMTKKMKKASKILLFVLVPAAVLLLLAALFSNKLFYTEKKYSDKVAASLIDGINTTLKGSRKSSAENLGFLGLNQNQTYKLTLDVDRKFAFENNFPYFEGLNLTMDTYSVNDENFVAIRLGDDSKNMIDVSMYVNTLSTVIALPGFFDGYYQPLAGAADEDDDEDDDEEYSSSISMFSAVTTYSGLNADEVTEVFFNALKDVIYYLPEDCYSTSIGIGNKSDILISASEKELATAIANTIWRNKDDEDFKTILSELYLIDESTYDEYVKSMVSDLYNLDTADGNYYTISISTNFWGSVQSIGVYTILKGNYNACELTFDKGVITGSLTNNEQFEDEVQEYTTKNFSIVYGVNRDKSIKGYFTLDVTGGSMVVYFENLKISDGGVTGDFSLEASSGNQLKVSIDSAEKLISAVYTNTSGDDVVTLTYTTEDNDKQPFDLTDIKKGARYTNLSTLSSDFLMSDAYTQLMEDIQYDQLQYWLEALSDLYLSDDSDSTTTSTDTVETTVTTETEGSESDSSLEDALSVFDE